MSPLLLVFAGLVVLLIGAEVFVRGASRLALSLGMAPLVIGLTVVAFGTSSPEVGVSLQAALDGRGALALGNAVGSNLFNILFILGLASVITPLLAHAQLIRRDVPVMIATVLLLLVLVLDGRLGRVEGLLLLAVLAAYVGFLIHQGRREPAEGLEEGPQPQPARGVGAWTLVAVQILAGLGALVVGSRWLVEGASALARGLGISEVVVGLTVVAAGTSLPEVATSVVASLRGERDLAVGNLVGSNVFNILGVLGLAATAAPAGLSLPPSLLAFDLPLMLAASVACLPIVFTGGVIDRREGVVLLLAWVGWTGWLVLGPGAPWPGWITALGLSVLLLGAAGWEIRRSRP